MPLSAPSTIPAHANGEAAAFRPHAVESFEEAGLSQAAVEGLVLKFLLKIGVASGRRIAEELGLPFGIFPNFFRSLKNKQIVAYTNSPPPATTSTPHRQRPRSGADLHRGVRLRRPGAGAVRGLRRGPSPRRRSPPSIRRRKTSAAPSPIC